MAVSTSPVGAAAVQTGPTARQALLDTYQRESATTLKILRAFPPEHAELRPHPMSNSAQQLAEVPKLALCTLMLNDSIHHRGQFSVYLRMTGSKVPSIYGPSRDEPWT